MKLERAGLTLMLSLAAACSNTTSEPAATETSEVASDLADTSPSADPIPTGVWRIDSISDEIGEAIPPAFEEETYGTRVVIWTDGDQMVADFCGSFGPSLVLTDRGGRLVGDIDPDTSNTMEACMEQVAFSGASFTAIDETTVSVDVLNTTVVLRLTDEDCPPLLSGDC